MLTSWRVFKNGSCLVISGAVMDTSIIEEARIIQ